MNECGDTNESGVEANAFNSSTQGLKQEDCRESETSLCYRVRPSQLKERRAGKVVQWVKVCAYKSEVLNSIPGICRMENENQLPHGVF